MKNVIKILIVVFMIIPEINSAQIMQHDTLYIVGTDGSLSSSPQNYLYNNHDEFKEFKLTFNVLEREEEWEFAYSDWCCDILEDNLTSSYKIPLEPGDSSFIKIGVFWNDQLTGYGVIELIFEDVDSSANQTTAIFIIDLLPSGTEEIVNQEIAVFPNPTSSNLSFKEMDNCSHIYIYDKAGKLVLNQPCSETNEILTSTLSAGQYFIFFKDVDQKTLSSASFVKR